MNWDEFQQQARCLVPPQQLKSSGCWVGVLQHNKALEERLTQDDFLWMICCGKTSLQKIYDVYGTQFNIADFYLQLRGAEVNTRDTVSTFLHPDDNPVLFKAVLVDRAHGVLEPPNGAAPSLETETLSPDTALDNNNSSAILPGINDFVSTEGQKTVIKQEPDQSPGALSPNGATSIGFSVDHDESTNRTPDQSGAEVPKDHFIRAILDQQNPDVLEAGIAESLKFLATLKHCFSQHTNSSGDAQSWVKSIDRLSLQCKRKRTIIGVVGNTGAGKSSVINALLDEERLLPTNCMRACTAVVTEVSWNNSESITAKYRAEIEFITPEDWEKELKILMNDFLIDGAKVCREASDPNTDAGISWAKFHAVYPHINRDSLDQWTIDDLMDECRVEALGTTRKVEAAEPMGFYRELQKYVDSKEKSNTKEREAAQERKEKKKKKPGPPGIEYWPLIKVVRIYTKAQALSTGAVIVDLPGVHDSNAARSAVAQRYMQQCTGLWIVAPITRAVDDQAAKTLLGEAFKMQLKYDGGFSSVTFICSKTDDISIMEAIEALGLQEEIADLQEQESRLRQSLEDFQDQIGELQESKETLKATLRHNSEELDEWMELQDKFDAGNKVYAPESRSKKRRKATPHQQASKRIREDSYNRVADSIMDDQDPTDDDDDDDEVAIFEPLQESDIKAKVKQLRETKKDIRQQTEQIQDKVDDLRARIHNLKNGIGPIRSEIGRVCISGRNEYSKGAIKQDFAAGIKELDQEIALEADEQNFDPDEETRNYDEVARNLPVFCVSSRAYQHQCGRFQQDDAVPGFTTLEETEVPQLQSHCQGLTKSSRIQTGRSFLLGLCQHLTTLELWATDDISISVTTDKEKLEQDERVARVFSKLKAGLQDVIHVCINQMKDTMNNQIFSKYPEVINEAIALAPETVERWGANKNDGGLSWSTYRAIVCRNGKYHSSTAGQRDFNAELVNPIIKKLAAGWERSFQNCMPRFFQDFIEGCSILILETHEAIEQQAKPNDMVSPRLAAMKTQTSTYESLFAELNLELVGKMNELQRKANRNFAPTIANDMSDVYAICASEGGKGSYARMKEHMIEHIDVRRRTMFNKATMAVKAQLQETCTTLESFMNGKINEIHTNMRNDYMRALGHIQAEASEEMKSLRSDVLDLVRSVKSHFESITKGDFTGVQSIGDADGAECERSGGSVKLEACDLNNNMTF